MDYFQLMFEPKSLLKNGPGFRSCLARLAIHSPSPMATASGGALSILEPSQARGAPCAPLPLALTVPAGALPLSPAQAHVELGPRVPAAHPAGVRSCPWPASGRCSSPLPAPPASTCASLPPASAAFPATAGCSCEAAFPITAPTPRFPRNQQFTESVSRPQDGNLFYELQITPPPTFTKDNSQNPAWFNSGKSNLIYTVVSKKGPGEDARSGDWEKVKSSLSFPDVELKSKKGL